MRLIEEHGRSYVDIRQWKVVRDKCFPTYSGVRFDAEYFPALKEAVEELARRLASAKTSAGA